MTKNTLTGAAFIAGGTVAGTGVSATVGGMGLAGGFGAVGIGTAPIVGASAAADDGNFQNFATHKPIASKGEDFEVKILKS